MSDEAGRRPPLRSRERRAAFETDGADVVSLDLSADSRRLALGLGDRTVLVFDLPAGPG